MTRNELRALMLLILLIAVGVGARRFMESRKEGRFWTEIPLDLDTEGPLAASETNESGGFPIAGREPAPADTIPPRSAGVEGRIDLNAASVEELRILPTIGEKRATAIVRLRESRGGFSRLEELFDVEGIGQKTFERIEPLVTVVPRASAAPRQDSPATTATIPAHVPVVAPVATAAPSSGASRAAPPGRVNINLADAEELETLWNVGPTKARAITEWRERHGPFKRPEDLTLVPGIGPQTLKRNLDRIAVEPFVRPADSAAFPSGSSPESRR